MLEADSGAYALYEGNIFQNVNLAQQAGLAGKTFAVANAAQASTCKASLGRTCQLNSYGSSGALTGTDSSFLGNFKGKNIASASAASNTKNLVNTAGYGRI